MLLQTRSFIRSNFLIVACLVVIIGKSILLIALLIIKIISKDKIKNYKFV